jgi:hypothetical protein
MLGTALQAALAFNLACTGTECAGPHGLAIPDSAAMPFEISYRVVLDLRRWCSDACDETAAGRHRPCPDPASRPAQRHRQPRIIFDPATRVLTTR